MTRALAPDDVEGAREAALRLLERVRRTRSELTRRLAERGYAEPTIVAALERLAGVGLIDDVEYARAYLAERWGRRAAGWRRLEADLRRRGVDAADIATARAQHEERNGAADETALARRVLEQSARRLATGDPRRRRQRAWSLLARRGFDGETIEQALREVTAAAASGALEAGE